MYEWCESRERREKKKADNRTENLRKIPQITP
jgi:hypothetical protein